MHHKGSSHPAVDKVKLEGQRLIDWIGEMEGEWRHVPAPDGLFVLERLDHSHHTSQIALSGETKRPGELTDILNLINSSRWSGEFQVITNAGYKIIWFKEGDVYAAKSSALEDRLGEVAIRAGLLNRRQLDEALAKCSDRKRLGAMLVDWQWLNTHELYSLIQKQTEEIFYSLLMVDKAQFFFRRESRSERLATAFLLPTQHLMLEGVQRIDEMSYFRERIESSSVVFEHEPLNATPPPMSEADLLVYNLVDGRNDLETISQKTRLGEFATTKAAFQLLQSKLIRHRRSGNLGDLGSIARRGGLLEVIAVFNDVFRRLHSEAHRQGRDAELQQAIGSFLEASTEFKDLFHGVATDDEGALDAERLVENVTALERADEVDYLYQGLNDFLFFHTFVAGETLDAETEEQLHERLNDLLQGQTSDEPVDDERDALDASVLDGFSDAFEL